MDEDIRHILIVPPSKFKQSKIDGSTPNTMNSPAFRKRFDTPLRSAMKGKNRKRTKLGWTASRLTFVSTPMVREYFGDAPVRWSVDLRENLNVSPSAMQHTELEQELEVREVEEDTNLMTPREKAAKVDTLWREEIESELMSYDFPPPMTNMAREQLVARLNLVKRLMSRANLFVLGGGNGHETFVTQYTNNQLQEQLLHYREAIHGVNACSSRAQYEDRLVAALLKDSTGRSGNGFDHGLTFMTVDEQLEEMDDEHLCSELLKREVVDIPSSFDDKYQKLNELIREEHEELLESAVEMVVENELTCRNLPFTRSAMRQWIQNQIKTQISNGKKNKSTANSSGQLSDGVASGRKRRRNDSPSDSPSDSRSSSSARGRPLKKKRKNDVMSSPSADTGGGGGGTDESQSSGASDADEATVIRFPLVKNWHSLTDKQLQMELLLVHFDNRKISLDGGWNDVPSYHSTATGGAKGAAATAGVAGGASTHDVSSKQVVFDFISGRTNNEESDENEWGCSMM